MKQFLHSIFAKVIAAVALLLVGVMIYAASTDGLATIPATLTGVIVTPLQSLTSAASDGISGFFSRLTDGGQLRGELEQLRRENAQLRQKIVDYDDIKQKNQWYSEILGLHEQHTDYTFASGRVIGRNPSEPYGNFIIAAGTNSGVALHDPVVSTDGSLVGLVDEVAMTYAKVRTVMDPATKVAAQISRTTDTAYTAGSSIEQARNHRIRLSTIDRASGVAIGDFVVTSGIGGIYPGGLIIGAVRNITNATDGMTLDADIELMADILNLKQVMVITSFDGQGTT